MSSVHVPISESMHRRREYHGDRTRVALDPRFAFSWLELYAQTTASMRAVCDRVMSKHEATVARYGYSLRDPRTRVHSSDIAPYLVPPMLPSDPF